MIRSDSTILTDHGVAQVKDLRPGERILNPITETSSVLKQALFRRVENGSPLVNSIYCVSAKSIHSRAPDQDLYATGGQVALFADANRRVVSVPVRRFGNRVIVDANEEVELCLLLLEKPSLFVANGLILEAPSFWPKKRSGAEGSTKVRTAI